MVDSSWSYTVKHYDKSSGPWTETDVSAGANEIPNYTDTSDRQINTATILMNAKNGDFIKQGTVIVHHDRMRIEVDDGASGSYDRYFDVVRRVPIKSKGEGTKLQLACEGTERWTQKINYAKPHYFDTPKNVLIDIVAHYNDNKGSDAPTLSIGTNELPDKGTFHFDFGVNEDSCYNRIFDLTEKMGSSGSFGGVLDFFDVRFTTPTVTTITVDVFSSGNVY